MYVVVHEKWLQKMLMKNISFNKSEICHQKIKKQTFCETKILQKLTESKSEKCEKIIMKTSFLQNFYPLVS